MKRSCSTCVLLIALLGAAPVCADPPNYVVLFADDLGYGDLSCYGSPTIHTPNLDRLAANGLKLTSFYAQPSCSPSRAALLTGRYPPNAQVPHVFGPESDHGLPAEEITLAEALRGHGYRTAHFGKWHLGNQHPFLPTDQGFDKYFGLLYSNDMIRPWVQTEKPLHLYENDEPLDEQPVDQTTLTTRYTARAVEFIEQSQDGPFFLYLAYSMPHLPISTAEQFRGRSNGGLYGDVIETIDWSVGQVIDALERHGLDANTLVFFSSDNGPWSNMPDRMLRDGRNQRWDAGSKGPLRGAKGTTYEGGVRVPAIFYWPGRIGPGRVEADIASTIDIFPTLTRIAGIMVQHDPPIDGVDISALVFGTGPSPRNEFLYHRGGQLQAVRVGPWKLRMVDGEEELFHLARDPAEQFNHAAEEPAIVSELKRRFKAD